MQIMYNMPAEINEKHRFDDLIYGALQWSPERSADSQSKRKSDFNFSLGLKTFSFPEATQKNSFPLFLFIYFFSIFAEGWQGYGVWQRAADPWTLSTCQAHLWPALHVKSTLSIRTWPKWQWPLRPIQALNRIPRRIVVRQVQYRFEYSLSLSRLFSLSIN